MFAMSRMVLGRNHGDGAHEPRSQGLGAERPQIVVEVVVFGRDNDRADSAILAAPSQPLGGPRPGDVIVRSDDEPG